MDIDVRGATTIELDAAVDAAASTLRVAATRALTTMMVLAPAASEMVSRKFRRVILDFLFLKPHL